MSVITLLILSVLVGWLATLILYSDIGRVSLPDFATGVIGAAIAGGLAARVLGIPMIGEYGFTLWGALASMGGCDEPVSRRQLDTARPIAVWAGDLPEVIGAIESGGVRAICPVVGEAAGVDDKSRR